MSNYLRSFVIGTSMIVCGSFLRNVYKMDDKTRNYSFMTYSYIVPLYFGIMNMLSLLMIDKFGLPAKYRYLFISILSAIIVILFARITNAYNFTENKQWYYYYINIFFNHVAAYFMIKMIEDFI